MNMNMNLNINTNINVNININMNMNMNMNINTNIDINKHEIMNMYHGRKGLGFRFGSSRDEVKIKQSDSSLRSKT